MTKTRIAIIYDFDRTLSVSEMQDGFIDSLGLKPKDFWDEVTSYKKENMMDGTLAYLFYMKRKCGELHKPLNRDVLKGYGASVKFFKGVEGWFDEIETVAKEHDVKVEHYLISAGLKEIIEGTPIAKYFKEIFACEYLYDENGTPVWIKNAINYTTKTQFIFRINKGVLDISDDESVNVYLPHDERPIPFENMIYIGDGDSDIPCMKLVKEYGGHSIGVYDKKKEKANELMYDERINFVCKADYSKDNALFDIVSKIIGKVSYGDRLRRQSNKDYKSARYSCEKKHCEEKVIDSQSTS